MKQDIKKPKVYIASPFFSPEQVARVEKIEKALEDNPFVEAYFSPMRNQVEQLPFGSKIWRDTVFAQDINHLEWADVVLVVNDFVDEYTDSGTAFEAGYAFATRKPILLYQEGNTNVNLMLSDSLHAYLKDSQELEDYNFLKMPKTEYKGQVI